jgi:diguanylate cyclase (GGDEF)-like protein
VICALWSVPLLPASAWADAAAPARPGGESFWPLLVVGVATAVSVGALLAARYRRLLSDAARRRAESEARAARLERERALLLDVLELRAAPESPRALLRKVTERIGAGLALDRLAIYLVEDERLVLRAFYTTADADPSPPAHEVELGLGLLGEVARDAEPLVLERASREPRTCSLPLFLAQDGWLGLVPITHEAEALGLVVASCASGSARASDPAPLLAALASQIGLSVWQDGLIRKLHDLSTHDELTGLANRRLLTSRLEAEAFRGQRFGHTTSVLTIDIDHFKQLNDRHGHATGDAALVEVARLMVGSVRKIDLVARLGGEEFVVVLPRTELSSALIVAEKLRAIIAAARIPGGASQPGGQLTVSIGVSAYGPSHDPEALLAEADRAMYRAKELGRNRVESAPPRAQRATAS